MKQVYLLLSSLILITACARTAVVQRADVQYIDTKEGVLTVTAKGYGIRKLELQENAERNALETLLFRGIPSSEQNLPLVSEEQQATYRSQPGYLRAFFDEKKYRQFITRSDAQGAVQATRTTDQRKTKSQTWLVGINLPALRRDMEANRVIRKFGY